MTAPSNKSKGLPPLPTALSGLLLVLILNLGLIYFFSAAGENKKAAADRQAILGLPAKHTWIYWATQELYREKMPPDVVLLGSSLVMIPVALQDADYLNKDIDASIHHHSRYMESTLAASLAKGKWTLPSQSTEEPAHTAGDTYKNTPNCLSLALPGGMISDDYMITRALLSGTHKPKVLVLGLTLRDFCDSHVSCAAATDVFKYLRNFMSVDDIVDLCMPEFWQRLDYWQSKINWLWDKKMLLQMQASQFLHSHMPKLAGQNPSLLNKLGEEAPTGNIAGQLKTEIEKGMFIVHANDNFPYTDNSGEYKTRFRGAGLKNLTNQSQFLALLLELAQAHKIKVILVNMPLTKANMALMPPGLYDQYLLRSKALAEQYHAPFLDLNDGKTFDQGDFRDTAHMRASGGRKLVDSVVKRMASLQYLRLF